MIRSNLSDYSEVYIPVKENIVVSNSAAQGATINNTNKKVTFKNCALFTSCATKINNTQVDDAQDIDIVISMYNLIEYSNTYQKTSGNTIEINQLQIIIAILLIFLLITMILFHSI